MKIRNIISISFLSIVLFSYVQAAQSKEPTVSIFHNGDIITMEGDKPEYVEAVVEEEGKIVFAGSREVAFEQYDGRFKEFDLKGHTMMPGFIEPHVHPSIAATILPNDIIAPYDWVLPTGDKKRSFWSQCLYKTCYGIN